MRKLAIPVLAVLLLTAGCAQPSGTSGISSDNVTATSSQGNAIPTYGNGAQFLSWAARWSAGIDMTVGELLPGSPVALAVNAVHESLALLEANPSDPAKQSEYMTAIGSDVLKVIGQAQAAK